MVDTKRNLELQWAFSFHKLTYHIVMWEKEVWSVVPKSPKDFSFRNTIMFINARFVASKHFDVMWAKEVSCGTLKSPKDFSFFLNQNCGAKTSVLETLLFS